MPGIGGYFEPGAPDGPCVAIEFASLPSYALVGSDKRNRLAAEASLKYMIFGAVCAAIMLYGASLLYGYFGTLNIAEIAAQAGLRIAAMPS